MVNKRKSPQKRRGEDEEEEDEGMQDSGEEEEEDELEDERPAKRAKQSAKGKGKQRAREGTTDVDLDAARARLASVMDESDELAGQVSRNASEEDTRDDMAGRIKHVYLENFMCHKKLSFDFGNNVNFVIGHNGSGKSAVLTAITIALKGKPTATSRGNSLKDFIKHGADRALIRIILRNIGPARCQHDIFGDEIIIERTIPREGSGGFKIKGIANKNKIISTRGEDVIKICSNFNIQVDNPLTVLTQDSSRAFLAGSDPHKKYRFFMQATQLEQLVENYAQVQKILDEYTAAIKISKERMPELERNHEKWKRMFTAIADLNEQKMKLIQIRKNYAWSIVIEKEQEQAGWQKKLDKVNNDLTRIDQKLADAEAALATSNEAVTSVEAQKAQFAQAETEAAQNDAALGKEWKEVNSHIRELVGKMQDLKRVMKDRSEDLDRLSAQLAADAEKSGQHAYHQKREALMKEKKAHEDFIAKLRAQASADEEKRQRAIAQRDATSASILQLQENRSQINTEAHRVQGILTRLQQQIRGKDASAKFGTNLQAIRDEIARARWFHSPPIGPLGQFVKLKPGNDRYRDVLDALLGNLLHAWAVRDPRDKATLLDIFRRCVKHRGTVFEMGRDKNAVPSVISHTGDVFDYRAGDLRHLHPTVLSLLEMTDPEVERIIINAAGIEKLFVATTRKEADGVARKFQKPGSTPNIVAADLFRVNGTKNGGLHTIPMNRSSGQSVLTTDIGSEVRKHEEAMRDIQARVTAIDGQIQVARQEQGAQQAAIAEQDDRRRRIDSAMMSRQAQIDKVDIEMMEDAPVSLAALTDARDGLEVSQNNDADQYTLLEQEKAGAEKKLEPIKERRVAVRDRAAFAQTRVAEFEAEIQEAIHSRVEAQTGQTHWQRKRKETEKTATTLQGNVDKVGAEVEAHTAVAVTFSERLVVKESSAQLSTEIKTLKSALERREKEQNLDAEAIAAGLNEATATMEAARANLIGVKALKEEFNGSLVDRRAKWLNLRTNTVIKTREKFKKQMERRGWTADLHFDHGNATLEIMVMTDAQLDKNGAWAQATRKNSKDPKSLSGGETSFSTMCLLLALWESISGPFRCLDEFDVFMDAANRKLSMQMLIDASRESGQDKQYILITPQDMNAVTLGNDVKAHRMPDPERGGAASQGRLPFERE